MTYKEERLSWLTVSFRFMFTWSRYFGDYSDAVQHDKNTWQRGSHTVVAGSKRREEEGLGQIPFKGLTSPH